MWSKKIRAHPIITYLNKREKCYFGNLFERWMIKTIFNTILVLKIRKNQNMKYLMLYQYCNTGIIK